MKYLKPRLRSVPGKMLSNQEFLLTVLIGVLLLAVIIKVPGFWHIETLFNILRDSMVKVLFALGVLLVIISGGIDVSFLAIGILAAYTTVRFGPQTGGAIQAFFLFAMAVGIGMILGLINAAVVLGAKASTLIATLATSAIFTGFLFAFVGGKVISTIPEPLQVLGSATVLTAPGAVRGTTRLNILIILVTAVVVIMWAFLRFTIAGRRVFAVGGDAQSAERAAISVPMTRIMVFVLAGGLAGLAGITHVTLSGRADPTAFTGTELDVLAAVVLGGALMTGGKGTVRGTILGVLLISLINTALVPLGVPSIWQKTGVGLLLLLGVCLQTVSARTKQPRAILEES